jgi:VIT1/CCC1 family predicted Fe2+/Mn2+ transporter
LLVFDRDAGRYAVHELLRQYAESELVKDAGSADLFAMAHTGYYADLAASAAETIESSEMHALQMMEGDLDNVRAAWRRALAEADASNAARFVEALWFLYEVRG